ncbi:MAG: oligosaccharide flippase family protein [Bacteroidaceae bacterium]|nr:oligosaccharide flippase family protein [Bacteroidaceae bacterium]
MMETKRGKADGAYDRIVKYTGVFGGVQGLVTLMTIVRTALVSRLLGTAGFGINESFNRTLNLVKSTTDLGLSFSAVRKISEYVEQDDRASLERSVLTVRSWALLTAVLGMLVCVLLAPLFSLWAFDGDAGYTLSFVLLSPVVAASAINGGEMAILKGARKLSQIALSQLLVVGCTFVISIPIFWYFRLSGLVLSLVLVSVASALVTCFFSFRSFPYRVSFLDRNVLRNGLDMIKLGVFFTIAAFFGSGALSAVANYLMTHGGAEVVGAYGAGYLLVSYLGMFVFSAMEADYFPRLSSVNAEKRAVNVLANRQVEVALLLMAPMVAIFMACLPLIVNVFLSARFADAIPMTRIAVLSLVFKAATQPLAYISLAKGDSRTFLLQEVLYDLFIVLAVIVCFNLGGLKLTGLALLASGVFDMIVVGTVTAVRYGFRYSWRAFKVMAVQGVLLTCLYLCDGFFRTPWSGILEFFVAMTSAGYSVWILQSHTAFLQTFLEKIKRRLKR